MEILLYYSNTAIWNGGVASPTGRVYLTADRHPVSCVRDELTPILALAYVHGVWCDRADHPFLPLR